MSAQGTVDLTGIFGSAETNRLPERDAGQHGDDRYDHVGVRSLLRAGIVDALVAGHLDEADHGRVAVSGVPVRAAQPLDKDEDEHNWAIRCAKMAKWLCKPIKRNRSR